MNLMEKVVLIVVACLLFVTLMDALELVDEEGDDSQILENNTDEGDFDDYLLMNLLEKLIDSRQRETRAYRPSQKMRYHKTQSAGWKRGAMKDDDNDALEEKRRYKNAGYSGYACQGQRCSAGWKRTQGVAIPDSEDLS